MRINFTSGVFGLRNWLLSISLKFKLTLLLITVASSVLVVFAAVALRQFEADKIAYVYETNRSHVFSTSDQIEQVIRSQIQEIRNSILNLKNDLKEGVAVEFSSSKSPIISFWVENLKDDGPLWLEHHNKARAEEPLARELDPKVFVKVGRMAHESQFSLRPHPDGGSWLIGLNLKDGDDEFVVIVHTDMKGLLEPFMRPQPQNTYLVDYHGEMVIQPHDPTHELDNGELQQLTQTLSSDEGAGLRVFEYKNSKGKLWLVAVSQVGDSELQVLSIIPKNVALAGVYILGTKFLVFLLMLLFITLTVGIFSAHNVTAKLRSLLGATKKVAEGEFDIKVEAKSKDEVGKLASSFNIMTEEIQRLLSETADKARMEEELKTAQLVQETLFPKAHFASDKFEIQGYYRPASECSGDWWHYGKIGSKVYMWIGDATGHGVPAALITSAAKSASSVIEHLQAEIDLGSVMKILNRAIFETGGGKVNMTFFVCSFDEQSGELSYSNASHDPPFLFSKSSGQFNRKSICVLQENNGNRLGEKIDSQYESTTIQLQPGDRVVFYTDGITELANVRGQQWGERRFLRSLVSNFNQDLDLNQVVLDVEQKFNGFRGDAVLNDDVTFFLFRYNEQDLSKKKKVS